MIKTGMINGIQWRLMNIDIAPFHITANIKEVIVLFPPDEEISDAEASVMEAQKRAYSILRQNIGYMPVDISELPEVKFILFSNKFDKMNLKAWLKDQIEIPENIDISFQHDMWQKSLYVSAKTMKNGHITDVKRKISCREPLIKSIEPIFAYFKRNCPRVEQESGTSCGAHIAELLKALDPTGRYLLDEWLAKFPKTQYLSTLTLPGSMLPGTGVSIIELSQADNADAFRAKITMIGEHTVVDDASGTTVVIKTPIPEAIRNSLKGISVHNITGVEWMRPLRVRTLQKSEEGVTSFRAYAEGVVPDLGSPPERPIEAIRKNLNALMTANGNVPAKLGKIEASAVPVLQLLSERNFEAVLSLLGVRETVQLEKFGQPGWAIALQGDLIVLNRCPRVSIEDIIESARGK